MEFFSPVSWLLAMFVGVVVMWLAMIFQENSEIVAAGGDEIRARRRSKKLSIFILIFGGVIRSLGQIVSILPFDKAREKVSKQLITAGRPGGLNVDEYLATQVIGLVIGYLAGSFVDTELKVFPIFSIMVGVVGFLYPRIWLHDTAEKRKRRIFRDLPDTLDTLRLAVEAGLDLSSAMSVVVEKGGKSPLIDELEEVERETSLGRTRKEAIKNFADRLGMSEINALALALIQADQLGASIGPILKIQSEMSRTRRWQLAETIVNKMPLKMMAPLVILIFPSSFIVLFTPIILQWMQSK